MHFWIYKHFRFFWKLYFRLNEIAFRQRGGKLHFDYHISYNIYQ
jgi:hypothetical protein